MVFAPINFGKEAAINELVWHKCGNPVIPKKTVDGSMTAGFGQTWRRKTADGQWEYKQDPETDQDYFDRQY